MQWRGEYPLEEPEREFPVAEKEAVGQSGKVAPERRTEAATAVWDCDRIRLLQR